MSQAALSPQQKKNIRLTVLSIIAVMAVFFGLFLNKLLTPREMGFEELKLNGVVTFDQARLLKEFSLTDHNQSSFDKSRLRNKLNLVFFGFVHCPDICPMTMAELAKVYNKLPADQKQDVQVILVSLDPARDSVKSMKDYVEYFDPSFVGLTGEFSEIMALSRNLNVAFNKVFLDDGYTIDHTSHIAILNGRGDYTGFIKTPVNIKVLPRIIESTLIKFRDI